MLNFTVGPVQASQTTLSIGSQQVPYFRTREFSDIMLRNETLIKKMAKSDDKSRVVFITGSGTASMEAAVINTLTPADRILIVNGGSFGQRFVNICKVHHLHYTEITLPYGSDITAHDLQPYDGQGYTAFLVNVHETSTGVHFNIDLIASFCKRNGLFLITDMVSSFIADEFDMARLGVDIMITGSQKALACPPGISVLVLSEKALQRVANTECGCFYLDLKSALSNGERGQTPFTPAVGILLQINARLEEIEANGGIDSETRKVAALAADFRNKIQDLPFEVFSQSMSNAVTALHPTTASAYQIFLTLKDEYGIWVCPNGGDMADRIFRVGHIGCLTTADNDTLINAFRDLQKRGII